MSINDAQDKYSTIDGTSTLENTATDRHSPSMMMAKENALDSRQHHYYENNRTRDPNKRDFRFKSTQINNSPYALIRDNNHQEIVRRGDAAEVGFKHIGNVSMMRSPGRKPFISTGPDVNEQRFNLPDTYDKSRFLGTISNIKCNVPFKAGSPRDSSSLIA